MKGYNIQEMFDLDGKVAIVGGGSGTLGRALAKGLAYAKADVVVAGIDPIKKLKSVSLEIMEIGRKRP